MTIQEKMAQNIPKDKLTLKVIEECMELSEVLVKTLTKPENLKPPISKISEEMGDVIVRMNILAIHYGIQHDVEKRVHEKLSQLTEWYSEKFVK